MERLLEPSSFRRIHRSAPVNEARIAELTYAAKFKEETL